MTSKPSRAELNGYRHCHGVNVSERSIATTQGGTAVFKYFLIFNGIFYVGQVTISAIGVLLDINITTGASMGAVIAGSIMAGRYFVLDLKRLPSTGETWMLVLGSFLLCLAISAILTALALLFVPDLQRLVVDLIDVLGIAALAAIMSGVILLYLAVMYFTLRFMLPRLMKDYRRLPSDAGTPEDSSDDYERKEPRLF